LNSSGINFTRLIDKTQQDTRNQTEALNGFKSERDSVFTRKLYMTLAFALGCHKGNHTTEYLSGRAFNLAYAAYGVLQGTCRLS
jgi:hypothetical protein